MADLTPVEAPGAAPPRAILDARHARHGTTLSAWEEAIRAGVQSQLELAVMRLSQDAPALLDDAGPKCVRIEVELPLPEGERLCFRGELELVEG